MSVQEYLEKHQMSIRIEEAVNAAVRAKSPEPILFIVCASNSSRMHPRTRWFSSVPFPPKSSKCMYSCSQII